MIIVFVYVLWFDIFEVLKGMAWKTGTKKLSFKTNDTEEFLLSLSRLVSIALIAEQTVVGWGADGNG